VGSSGICQGDKTLMFCRSLLHMPLRRSLSPALAVLPWCLIQKTICTCHGHSPIPESSDYLNLPSARRTSFSQSFSMARFVSPFRIHGRKCVHGLLKRFLNLDDYRNLDVLFALKQLYDLTVRPCPKVNPILVIIRL
jgi:hypothetical protein